MPLGFPTFSPDGKRIAYEQQVGIQRDIVIMNADGTGRLNLTSANTTQDQFPSFSRRQAHRLRARCPGR